MVNKALGVRTSVDSSGKRETLSDGSPYERLFGTRKRSVGRPLGDTEPLFAVGDSVDPVVALVAKRRAYAVVHEEQRDRLKSLFAAELKVLRRRGAARVAADAGVALKVIEPSGGSVGSEKV